MKLREIERLRAVAILMVMAMHWDCVGMFLPEVAKQSWSGVDLFFVISGYVVTLSLVRMLPPLEDAGSFLEAYDRAKQTLKVFYTRRFFRIVPAALAGALMVRVFLTVFPQNFGSSQLWQQEMVAFFGGIYNYTHAFHRDYRLGPYWSLSVEEHFYLILPVLFVLVRTTSRRLGACFLIIAGCALARTMAHPDVDVPMLEFHEKFSSHLRFDSLMAGVALALVADRASVSAVMPKPFMRFVLLPACALLVGCLPGAAPAYEMHRVGFIALWFLSGILVFFAGLDRGYVFAFPVVGRVLEYIGARSYALYIVHLNVARIDDDLRLVWTRYAELVPREGEHPWQRVLVLSAGSLVAAEIMHRTIELPFLRLGKRLVDPGRTGPLVSRRAKVLWAVGLALFGLVYVRHRIFVAFGPPNLARGKPVIASSHEPKKPAPEALTNGELESEFGLHTQREMDPWAEIDLGQPTHIGSIRIYNRADGWADEVVPLEVTTSTDGESYHVLATREEVFTQAFPWRIRVTGGPPVRYVRFHVKDKVTALCLSEVEIYGTQGMAALP